MHESAAANRQRTEPLWEMQHDIMRQVSTQAAALLHSASASSISLSEDLVAAAISEVFYKPSSPDLAPTGAQTASGPGRPTRSAASPVRICAKKTNASFPIQCRA